MSAPQLPPKLPQKDATTTAAVKLQAAERGRATRSARAPGGKGGARPHRGVKGERVGTTKAMREGASPDDQMTSAAVRIQATHRGRQTRHLSNVRHRVDTHMNKAAMQKAKGNTKRDFVREHATATTTTSTTSSTTGRATTTTITATTASTSTMASAVGPGSEGASKGATGTSNKGKSSRGGNKGGGKSSGGRFGRRRSQLDDMLLQGGLSVDEEEEGDGLDGVAEEEEENDEDDEEREEGRGERRDDRDVESKGGSNGDRGGMPRTPAATTKTSTTTTTETPRTPTTPGMTTPSRSGRSEVDDDYSEGRVSTEYLNRLRRGSAPDADGVITAARGRGKGGEGGEEEEGEEDAMTDCEEEIGEFVEKAKG